MVRRREEEPETGRVTKDPVCGMEVDPRHAEHSVMHGNREYLFCSAECQEQFRRDPERYVPKMA